MTQPIHAKPQSATLSPDTSWVPLKPLGYTHFGQGLFKKTTKAVFK